MLGQAGAKPIERPLVGDTIHDNVLWACTTCRWCVDACPVFIEHVPKIVDMRRWLVLTESRFPAELQPAYSRAHNGVGVIHLLCGRLDEAAAAFEYTLTIDPESPEALSNLSQAHSRAGRFTEALPFAQRAVKIRPDNPSFLLNLAVPAVHPGHLGQRQDRRVVRVELLGLHRELLGVREVLLLDQLVILADEVRDLGLGRSAGAGTALGEADRRGEQMRLLEVGRH